MNVPTIPRQVADVIEFYRSGMVETDILVKCVLDPNWIGEYAEILRSIPFETLLTALINGYNVEKTPEDKIRVRYEEHGLTAQAKAVSAGNFIHAGRCDGYRQGVVETLAALKIEIKGVNA